MDQKVDFETTIRGGVHVAQRHDSAHKHVTGLAEYTDDIAEPVGTLHAYLGLADRALQMTVAYGKERVQFGRPIGSFQALKHRMADVFARTELARSASWAASYALAEDAEDADFLTRAAASYAIETAQLAASECVQLHGGIAITWEHDAHLVFKRAHALGQLFGAPHRHRAAVAL